MRRFALPFFVLALLFGVSHRVQAQDNPTTGEQGLKPYGSFHGGDIDSISLANTKLNLHIPLVSYPQRGGKLHVGFSVISTAPVYTPTVECVGKPPQCFASYQRTLSLTRTLLFRLCLTSNRLPGALPLIIAPTSKYGTTDLLIEWSCRWRLVEVDGRDGYVYNPTTQVLTDRSVNQCSSYKVEDPNGTKSHRVQASDRHANVDSLARLQRTNTATRHFVPRVHCCQSQTPIRVVPRKILHLHVHNLYRT